MFLPYDRMEEKWQGDLVAERALARERWVVTEKIHGANFVIVAEPGERLRYAKRRELLAAGESFFGHETVVVRIAEQLQQTVDLARSRFGTGTTILIYGELFGGHYPHPNVSAIEGQKPVQTGVWYSPKVEFCAFDLGLVVDGVRSFVDYEVALDIFHRAGLFCAEPILIGSFSAAIKVPFERPSVIAARLGMPALKVPNLAEGVVVKTVRAVELPDGRRIRPAFKRKIAAFAEDHRYHGAQKSQGSPEQSADALGMLLVEAFALFTPPRAAAAISKVGAIDTDSRREQAEKELTDDVLEELSARAPSEMAALTPSDRELLRSQLAMQSRSMF